MSSPLFALLLGLSVAAPEKHPFTVDDLLAMQRISDPDVSPDGKEVAFSVRDTDLAANRGRMDLWLVGVDGSNPRRLTTHPENDDHPVWSADGKFIYFTSTRSGSSQIWRIARTGGEAEQVTKLPLDIGGFRLYPDGKRILIALDVLPSGTKLADTTAFLEKEKNAHVRIYDELLFRHWDTWEDGLRSHLFVWSPDAPEAPIDLMAGIDADSPTHPFGGMEETAISPDGKTVIFGMRADGRASAWSTNLDLYAVPSDGKQKPKNLTAGNKATDDNPIFSPDGKSVAFLAMARPQYESDRRRIALYDVASDKVRMLTEAWDRSPEEIAYAPDGKTIYAVADHLGHRAIFGVDAASGQVRPIYAEGWNGSVVPTREGLVFTRDHLRSPVELMTMKADGSGVRAITGLNKARVDAIDWGEPEQFSFTGAHGDAVFGWVIKPAGGVKPGQKVPVAFLVHGGPQGSFGDHFHYRWHPEVYAGHGYATIMIDFHGSTGYGQKFTDAINGDWGGAPYEDLMKGLDFALEKYKFLDGNRVGALGASYGGYMINWINGHTDRFKALVAHDGNIDERMAYFDTEELWFPEWEHSGVPWENDAGYTKHNPVDFIKNWKTPTLVVHGGRDYRVVETQGMGAFTALRRKGVPARFVYFPEENHWVLKPENSKTWHREVLGWLDKWVVGKK
ncbi:MAG: S9 family peptidase [Myxococcota bacterium]